MTVEQRIEALRGLIELRESIPVSISRLRQFPWDSDRALVVLTGNDLARMLDRYLQGELSNMELEEWANALEGRDDIGYEPSTDDNLRRIIFELANPLLATPIGPAQVQRWKEAISEAD
jgi:hypothetical protein